MRAFVVDTNVGVAANGKADQANPCCVISSINMLQTIRKTGLICIDSGRLILREYHRHLSPSGQPGVGDMFMKWVWLNEANSRRCEQVPITPNIERDFEEFPNDGDLSGFDADDRKFVAVALTSARQPEVVNAVDSDWAKCRELLEGHGVKINNICPDCLKA